MGQIIKDAIKGNLPFWILTVTAILLIVTAFLLPPMAIIDSSVLAAVGELAGFGALWAFIKAMDKGLDAKVRHNNTEVLIGDITDSEAPRYPMPSQKADEYEQI